MLKSATQRKTTQNGQKNAKFKVKISEKREHFTVALLVEGLKMSLVRNKM